jgi:hypothetical protein
MPRQLRVHIELPDTAVKHLRDEEIEAKVREALNFCESTGYPKARRPSSSGSIVMSCSISWENIASPSLI